MLFLGLLLITSTIETGDRIELAVAAGRIRMALRLGVKDKKKEDKEKDKVCGSKVSSADVSCGICLLDIASGAKCK